MKKQSIISLLLLTTLLTTGCVEKSSTNEQSKENSIVGGWKGKIQFKTGSFTSVKDLEFMYVFNEGGTLTESSNYDGAPPVPPAYGIWRKTGEKEFEARYEFYWTKVPQSFEELIKSSGFVPSGYGILHEKITLSEDGKSFKSTITYNGFDQAGNPTESGTVAETEIKRMEF
jgi:hypothetical protein